MGFFEMISYVIFAPTCLVAIVTVKTIWDDYNS